MYKKLLTGSAVAAAFVLLTPAAAFAHVVVTPSKAATGEHVLFSISVPNEETDAVVGIKLAVPNGATEVTPTTKDGWTIKTETKNDQVTTINWTEGTIPEGQRQDFTFSAQVPTTSTKLNWKAYQTYADGTTVAWDQKPTSDHDDDDEGGSGPYSITTVADEPAVATSTSSKNGDTALVVSVVALALSLGGLVLRKK